METSAILARWPVVGVSDCTSALTVVLLVLGGYAYAPNEVVDQVGELLLMALGKPIKDRRGNRRHRSL